MKAATRSCLPYNRRPPAGADNAAHPAHSVIVTLQPRSSNVIPALSSMKRPVLEPVVLLGAILMLGNLATVLHKSSRVYLFQQAQCFNYYQMHDPTKIEADYHIEEALCKLPYVQSRLSIVDGVDSFLQFLPREPSEFPSHADASPQSVPLHTDADMRCVSQ